MARGSKRKRGDTWQLRVYVGVGPEGRQKFRSETFRGGAKAADSRLRDLIAEVEGGYRSEAHTFGDAAEKWITMRRSDLSPSSYMVTRGNLDRYLIPRFGKTDIARLRAEDLDTFYGELRAGKGSKTGKPLAPSYIGRMHSDVGTILEQARKWRWIATNPAVDATPPAVAKRRATTPPGAVARQMYEAALAAEPSWGLFLRLQVVVGNRPAELVALQWRDVDLDAGTIDLDWREVAGVDADGRPKVFRVPGTKSQAGRTVSLDVDSVRMLRAQRRAMTELALSLGVRLGPDAYVFSHDPAAAVGWAPKVVTRRFARLRERLGVDSSVRLYDLRHMMISESLDAGHSVAAVSERAGHSARTMLGVYAHGVSGADRAIAEHMATMLSPDASDVPLRSDAQP